MINTNFKDHFSQQSDLYLKYRPLYPDNLYSYLSSLVAEHKLAWDCGTGNGQAAIGLSPYFDKVIATDPSEKQISNCIQRDNVIYKVEKAEINSIESNSVNLITIANALHWLDFNPFYKEVNRVLKPNGIIAAWAYGLPIINNQIDKIIYDFHFGPLNDLWLSENRLVEKEYTTIPFPFIQIKSPMFYYEKDMNINDLIGYLNTWSAVQRYINKFGDNPTEALRSELQEVWEPETFRNVRWNLILKAGKCE